MEKKLLKYFDCFARKYDKVFITKEEFQEWVLADEMGYIEIVWPEKIKSRYRDKKER